MSSVFPITDDPRYRRYTAGAGQAVFPVPFPFLQDEDLGIYLQTAPSEYTLFPPETYILTGAGDPAGGTLTFNSPRTAGDIILVLGEAILDRLSSIVRDGRFSSSLIDSELDRVKIIEQEFRRDAQRAMKVDYGGDGVTLASDLEDGDTLMKQGDRLVKGANAADIANAQEYAAQAHAGADAAAVSAEAADDARQAAVDIVATVPAEAAVRVIEVDIRMSEFAGGAPLNGIDDDSAAIQAAIDYFKPYSQYGAVHGNPGVYIRIPRGQVRIDAASVNMTAAHGVSLKGEGHNVTTLKGSANQPTIVATDVAAAPLTQAGVLDLTIEGPGAAQTLADGIKWGANNNCRINARIWSSRNALSLANSWSTLLDAVRIDGQGGIACYNGIYQRDGELAVAENALEIRGGMIQGCLNYGYRGECITGTKVFGLEVVGCGTTGVYLGDSPGGKELKWFSWVGGLIDTCPDLLVVSKGTSTVAELLHFSGLWMGYASDPVGAGIGADFRNIQKFTFSADIIVNTVHALNLQGCVDANVQIDTISMYDRKNSGGAAIIVNGTTNSRLYLGSMRKNVGSPSTTAIIEQNGAARNRYFGADADGNIVPLAGNRSRVIGCRETISGVSQDSAENMPQIEFAQLPVATAEFLGRTYIVRNTGRGHRPAFCDGAQWRFVSDDAVVA